MIVRVVIPSFGGFHAARLRSQGSVKKRYQEYPSKATKGVRNIFFLCSRDQ